MVLLGKGEGGLSPFESRCKNLNLCILFRKGLSRPSMGDVKCFTTLKSQDLVPPSSLSFANHPWHILSVEAVGWTTAQLPREKLGGDTEKLIFLCCFAQNQDELG